jgi:heme/copper-type cytochrome/quinol oxidase subunit 3
MSATHPPYPLGAAPAPSLETRGAVRAGDALDVRALPSYGFGASSLMWWGTLGVMAIEGTVFAMAAVAYFYLRTQADEWPLGVPPPKLLWGTLNTLILLASAIPNQWAKRAAQRHDLEGVRRALPICIAFAVAFIVVRAFEFTALECRWDTNAYGSIGWMLLGLHTTHLLTDFADTAVLAVLMFTGPLEGKRFADVAENAVYWDFVVLAWLPIYAVIYWAPRF